MNWQCICFVLLYLSTVLMVCCEESIFEAMDGMTSDTDDCTLLGFSKETLRCSYCDMLPKFDLSLLQVDCKRCCNPALLDKTEGTDGASTKFAKARLEVCWCKFPSMPQIEAFVKSEEKQRRFKHLELKHVQYQNPIIKLFNEDGNVVETLAINKWTTDTIIEFFASHLQNEEDFEHNEL